MSPAAELVRSARGAAWAACTAAATLALACDVAVPATRAADAGTSWVVSTNPSHGWRGVSRRPRIRAQLDRRVLARSVHSGSVRVESGPVTVRSSTYFEPVSRQLIIESDPNFRALEPQTAYRIRIQGLVDLDGNRQPDPSIAVFRTGDAIQPPPAPSFASWEEVERIFERRCVDAACHNARLAAGGLDLSSPEGVRETALGVRSSQFPGGTTGSEGAPGAPTLAALPIIDALAGRGSPASSYLLFKVLADDHILGDPMPPPTQSHPGGLDRRAAETLSSWIRGGAPTR